MIQRKVKGAAYEPIKISYTIPLSEHSYTPDIVLANGIILEVKGRLMKADRDKHILIKNQYPNIDLRFVFQNANNKIRKGSQTTYAQWCEKNDIKWCEKLVPDSWLKE